MEQYKDIYQVMNSLKKAGYNNVYKLQNQELLQLHISAIYRFEISAYGEGYKIDSKLPQLGNWYSLTAAIIVGVIMYQFGNVPLSNTIILAPMIGTILSYLVLKPKIKKKETILKEIIAN